MGDQFITQTVKFTAFSPDELQRADLNLFRLPQAPVSLSGSSVGAPLLNSLGDYYRQRPRYRALSLPSDPFVAKVIMILINTQYVILVHINWYEFCM